MPGMEREVRLTCRDIIMGRRGIFVGIKKITGVGFLQGFEVAQRDSMTRDLLHVVRAAGVLSLSRRRGQTVCCLG